MFFLGISDFRGLLLESSFASELDSDQVEKHLQRISFFFSKSKRLPIADSGGESFLFFVSESQLRYKMEQVRCYGCSNLLILASLEECRAYKRDWYGISFHHNCVRQEFLTSKCVSCNTYTDGLLLKTVPFPDLVVIEEERSELAPSKILCVICMESESAH